MTIQVRAMPEKNLSRLKFFRQRGATFEHQTVGNFRLEQHAEEPSDPEILFQEYRGFVWLPVINERMQLTTGQLAFPGRGRESGKTISGCLHKSAQCHVLSDKVMRDQHIFPWLTAMLQCVRCRVFTPLDTSVSFGKNLGTGQF